jgi:UrcA family protein
MTMTKQIKSTGFAALAFSVSLGLVGLTVAQPASAASVPNEFRVTAPTDEPALTKTVRVGDLDLANPADFRRLEFRISAASRVVCAPLGNGQLTPAEAKCRTVAKRSTYRQVAGLLDRADKLAAAGVPSRFDAVLTVVAPNSGE